MAEPDPCRCTRSKPTEEARIRTGIAELDRVLGGDPGIGKSTLIPAALFGAAGKAGRMTIGTRKRRGLTRLERPGQAAVARRGWTPASLHSEQFHPGRAWWKGERAAVVDDDQAPHHRLRAQGRDAALELDGLALIRSIPFAIR